MAPGEGTSSPGSVLSVPQDWEGRGGNSLLFLFWTRSFVPRFGDASRSNLETLGFLLTRACSTSS